MAKLPQARYRPLGSPNRLLTLGFITLVSIIICWLAAGHKLDLSNIYLGAEEDVDKLAFATILLPRSGNSSGSQDVDHYFTSTRMLNYQLNHSKKARSQRWIPFLVVVLPNIVPWKRKILEREGVTISFLDADTYLLKLMDKTFSDPSTMPTKTGSIVEELRPDEAPLPKRVPLGYAPTDNAHVTSLAASSMASLQCSTYPEQNLLNYAHRNWGNMPWAHLRVGWNVNLPNMNDIRRGVKSVHEKLWEDGDQLEPFSDELRMIWKQTKAEKEGFYDVMGHRLGWLDLGPIG
ncbi:uncharacterized protein RAG0_03594 [Rhynchosporium agropyri]|uniref:Uncharacterized protein n=1 Tax=Rhynchosporium agropyri TaxID=914238 RepID=A0A1E1K516_9HELO|nr:uncharacterized protein RAG0_03594 [Rhynchosporium agropyri]